MGTKMDTEELNKGFMLGDWRIDPLTNTFKNKGLVQHVEPKVMDVLLCLAREAGQVVKRDTLLEMVWGDVVVTDEVLTRCISELRAALGDTARERVYIRTVPKRGYSLLIEPAALSDDNGHAVPEAQPMSAFDSSIAATPDQKAAKGFSPVSLVMTLVVLSIGLLGWWLQSGGASRDISAARPDPKKEQQPVATIAVLPFANLSGDENSDYFSDGLTEDIRHNLISMGGKGLRVVARASSEVFRNRAVDIRTIGKQLGVQLLVEGTVRMSEQRVRVTAQLTNVEDGYPVWAERFEYARDDILNIQGDIADKVVDHVSPALKINKKNKHIASAKAYDYYLLGRHHWDKRTPASLRKAAEYFRQALQIDENYALALSGLADTYVLDLTYNKKNAMASIDEAQELVRRALRLAPDLAEVNASQGVIYRYIGDNEGAKQAYRRAVELNPDYAMGRMWLGNLYLDSDEANLAYEHYSAALKVDPLNPIIQQNHLGVLMMMGRYDEARELLERYASQQGAEHALKKWMFGMLQAGMYDSVLSLAVRQNFSDQVAVYATDALTQALIYLQRYGDAEALIGERSELFSLGRSTSLQAMLAIARRQPETLAAAADRLSNAAFEKEHWYKQCADGMQSYWRGLALVMQEDYQQAQSLFAHALNTEAQGCEQNLLLKAEISAYYAQALYKSGQQSAASALADEVIADLDEAISKGVYGPELLLMRVAVWHAVGKDEERDSAHARLLETQWPYYARLAYMPLFDNVPAAFNAELDAAKERFALSKANSAAISLSKFGL
jgi:adenylate cyclase